MGMWSRGANLPVEKMFHTVASLNGAVYVFAGVTKGRYYSPKSYKYDVAGNTWTAISDFPLTRFLLGTAQAVNGKIYIMGGMTNFGNGYQPILDVYEYDPGTDTYTKKARMPKPQARAASGVIDGKIYVIGGVANTYSIYNDIVQVYDPATNSWSSATNFPKAVSYLSAATVNNKIIVTGGYNATFTPSRYIADTYVGELNGGTLTWTKVKDYPLGPTILISGVGVGNKAYFFGGRASISGNPPAVTYTYSYEPATDTWTDLERKPTGMQYMHQAGTNGQVVVSPGGQDFNQEALAVVEILNTSAQATPVLRLHTTEIVRTIKKGSFDILKVMIENPGLKDLTWQANNNGTAWIVINPPTGKVLPGKAQEFLVKLDAGKLDNGNYSGKITVTSNDPDRSSVDIPVNISVQEQDVDEPRNVFLEEITGTWCGWCPYGADIIRQMVQKYPDNLVVVSYHNGNNEPMKIPEGVNMINFLGGSSYPSAAVDRIKYPGVASLFINRDKWEDAYLLRVQEGSPVGITLRNYSYNASTKQVEFDADVFFHQALKTPIRLNVMVTESGLNYAQSKYQPNELLYPYFHNHVVKQILPDYLGTVISDGALVSSQSTVTKHFSFVSADSAAKNTNVVLVVHSTDGKTPGPVLQSKEVSILTGVSPTAVGEVGIPASISLDNYPNPFGGTAVSPTTSIRFDLPYRAHVVLKVFDALGREVATLMNTERDPGVHFVRFDGSRLPAGMYISTLIVGRTNITRKMVIQK